MDYGYLKLCGGWVTRDNGTVVKPTGAALTSQITGAIDWSEMVCGTNEVYIDVMETVSILISIAHRSRLTAGMVKTSSRACRSTVWAK